jgi:hypothetical protein
MTSTTVSEHLSDSRLPDLPVRCAHTDRERTAGLLHEPPVTAG